MSILLLVAENQRRSRSSRSLSIHGICGRIFLHGILGRVESAVRVLRPSRPLQRGDRQSLYHDEGALGYKDLRTAWENVLSSARTAHRGR